MTLVPWDPFRNILSLQERMNRLFDDTMKVNRDGEPLATGTWMPAVDIYETAEEIVLVAELPGIEPADVDVQLRDNTLSIKGERKMEKAVKDESYHRVERVYGSFSRTFTLPATVDQEKINANFSKGLLEIKMPKAVQAKPQKIDIVVK